MKILFYSNKKRMFQKSGIGRAFYHQQEALRLEDIQYTLNSQDDFDIVHFNTIFGGSYRFLKKAKKHKKIVVVHGHSTKEDYLKSFIGYKITKYWFNHKLLCMYRNADLIITPTEYSKKLIQGYKNIHADIKVISNGIDCKNYQYNSSAIEKFENYFQIKNEPVVIGVGFYFERKGIHDFFEIARKMPHVKFIWFGKYYKILSTTLIKKIMRKKPSNLILPGYINSDIIKGAFLKASCLLFPSYEETEGIVVLEALASKLPVIVRDIQVFKPWLVDQINCFKGQNNNDFIRLIDHVLDNDNMTIIENGYKVALERDLSKIGTLLRLAYQSKYN